MEGSVMEGARAAVDREALLAALAVAPDTYSRNRFFDLYRDPDLYRIRRRAAQLRGIAAQVSGKVPGQSGEDVSFAPMEGGRVRLTYRVTALGLRRTALLDPLELSLVRLLMARPPEGLPPDDPDRARVDAALARLAQLAPSAQPDADASGASL